MGRRILRRQLRRRQFRWRWCWRRLVSLPRNPLRLVAKAELANEINRTGSVEMASQLKALAGVLGLLGRVPRQFLQGDGRVDGNEEKWIEERIAARVEAKKLKNFAEADRIRNELLEKGIVLEDRPGGKTEWRRS